ncbi:hypothetical protein [Nioella nitratireducens]|uniref:hypothetical protein n=1 Tax=Nioella nitratireducens TaxID=1287720 RepID=UPI0008FD5684|nr:hypothetical protein [Nioella nitratireducens]
MRIGLCLFFNYPFEKNFPILRRLYGDYFDEIRFIQPLVETSEKDAFTVYRAAFNFSGFFSDARQFIKEMNCDVVIFAGDDCIINRDVLGNRFEEVFGVPGDGFDMFVTKLWPFSANAWWKNMQKLRALGRLFGQGGIFDQRIQNWKSYFPQADELALRLESLGVVNGPIDAPPSDIVARMPLDQQAVIRGFFQGKGTCDLPYPLAYGISDFFIVGGHILDEFCHNAGLFAALNVFSEFSTPTALAATQGRLSQCPDLGLSVDWTYGNNPEKEFFVPQSFSEIDDFLNSMPKRLLYKHPVKLSTVRD